MSITSHVRQARQRLGQAPTGDPAIARAGASCMPYDPPRVRIAGNLRDLVAQTGSDIERQERQMHEQGANR
jgi:hypothetical protein